MSKLFPVQPPQRLSEQVYQTLRSAILEGDLTPGERLVEAELANRLQVSRTPVRDSLRLLAAERLVRSLANGRFEVVRPTLQEVKELYECRMALEGTAARLAAGRCRGSDPVLEETLDGMALAYRREDLAGVRDWNTRFHERLLQLADNATLAELAGNIRSRILMVRSLVLKAHQEPRHILEDHRQIVAAVTAGDGMRSETLVREHIARNLQTTLSVLSKQLQSENLR